MPPQAFSCPHLLKNTYKNLKKIKKANNVLISLYLTSIKKYLWRAIQGVSNAMCSRHCHQHLQLFPNTVILYFSQKLGHKLLYWKAFIAVWMGLFCSRGYNNKRGLQAYFFQTLGRSMPVWEIGSLFILIWLLQFQFLVCFDLLLDKYKTYCFI